MAMVLPNVVYICVVERGQRLTKVGGGAAKVSRRFREAAYNRVEGVERHMGDGISARAAHIVIREPQSSVPDVGLESYKESRTRHFPGIRMSSSEGYGLIAAAAERPRKTG